MGSDRSFKVKLYFSYDGTPFHGWQRQANTPRTIQEEVERALSRIAGDKVTCTASGRTDSGVHARVQVAHAVLPQARLKLVENGRLVLAMNSVLPSGVRLLRAERVSPKFHAQRDVIRKTYLYFINPSPVQSPALSRYSWHLRLPLDWGAMAEATQGLEGTHDFKAFCDADASTKTSVRTIYEARWGLVEAGPFGAGRLYALRVTGNGFLKHMVRSLVGTLVHIGNGKAGPELVGKALRTQERKLAGPTAPPQGLWLWDILYLT